MFFEPLKKIANNIINIDSNKIIVSVLSKNGLETFIADLNRGQLLEGFGSDDQSLMKYVDDPFFKSTKQALAYQKWKESISPSSSKPVGVMDFYINGYFHSTIKTDLKKDSFVLDSDASFADSIASKEPDAFGLSTDSKNVLIKIILPLIIEEIKINLTR